MTYTPTIRADKLFPQIFAIEKKLYLNGVLDLSELQVLKDKLQQFKTEFETTKLELVYDELVMFTDYIMDIEMQLRHREEVQRFYERRRTYSDAINCRFILMDELNLSYKPDPM